MDGTAILAGDEVQEGGLKPVTDFAFDFEAAQTVEAAWIGDVSDRLMRDPRVASAVLQRGRDGLARSINSLLLAALADEIPAPFSGDVAADLRSALALAPPATGYVIAAEPGIAAQLALDAGINISRRAGMRGGMLAEGLLLVPVVGADLTVLPATMLGFIDFGVELMQSKEASITFTQAPNPPTMHNLYQRNRTGVRFSREFGIVQAAPVVRVVGSA